MNERKKMTESDLRAVLAAEGFSWEIDAEISLLGADTIIAAMEGDGDLATDAGWDENIVNDVISRARAMGFRAVFRDDYHP
jgi:hypothetical protein